VNARCSILVPLLLGFLSSGCATHELVLSRTLRPVLSSKEVNFPVTHFHARVQMGRLEVGGRVTRSDGDYRTDFNCEIASAAALCGALAKSDLTFEQDWNTLVLELTHEYGSQWRWKNTLGSIKVSLRRETLLELRERKVPASEYPQYWQVVAAYKWGPPDHVPYAWPAEHATNNPGK
jgi:hypothetical protein